MSGVHGGPGGGVGYRLTAQAAPDGAGLRPPEAPPAPPAPGERPPRRVLPARPGRRWLAGDLHAHTVHSDGVLTVDELPLPPPRRRLHFPPATAPTPPPP